MSIPRIAKAMDYIDDDLVSGAVEYKRTKKKNAWMKWGAMAACLCLVVIGAFIAPSLNDGAQDYTEVVIYNGAEYVVCGAGEASILERCGLPSMITADLAGEYLGDLAQDGEGEFHYAIGSSEDSSMKIYEYAPEPNDNVYILCKNGEYYAAIRRDSNGYYGLPSANEGDEFRYPIRFEPTEEENEYRYPLGYETNEDEFRYPILFVPNEPEE